MTPAEWLANTCHLDFADGPALSADRYSVCGRCGGDRRRPRGTGPTAAEVRDAAYALLTARGVDPLDASGAVWSGAVDEVRGTWPVPPRGTGSTTP